MRDLKWHHDTVKSRAFQSIVRCSELFVESRISPKTHRGAFSSSAHQRNHPSDSHVTNSANSANSADSATYCFSPSASTVSGSTTDFPVVRSTTATPNPPW